MILLIDNYDSFTYNLYQLFSQQSSMPLVVKANDEISIEAIKEMKPKGIIISPGPGAPEESGICVDVVAEFSGQIPILGICLGMQVIGKVFNQPVVLAPSLCHGKIDSVSHQEPSLLAGLPSPFKAVRYHSLAVEAPLKSNDILSIAYSDSDQALMAIQHQHHPTFGLQFHPESYGSAYGEVIASNFLKIICAFDHAKRFGDGDYTEEDLRHFIMNNPIDKLEPTTLYCHAQVLKNKAILDSTHLNFRRDYEQSGILDVCGTGGDGLRTINVSTLTAYYTALAGIPTAKHGNRAVSGLFGSMDLVDSLAATFKALPNLLVIPAQQVHKAMAKAAPIRKAFSGPTCFNFIGPLSNPMPLQYQMVGVSNTEALMPMAKAMRYQGIKRGLVYTGAGGIDEVSLEGPTIGYFVCENEIAPFALDPKDLMLPRIKNTDYSVQNHDEALKRAHAVIENHPAYAKDRLLVALNTAIALWISEHPMCPHITESLDYVLTQLIPLEVHKI